MNTLDVAATVQGHDSVATAEGLYLYCPSFPSHPEDGFMSKSRSSINAFVCLTATFLVALLGATSGALANDPAGDAEQLIRRGIQLRKTRDDQAAAREFQKA